MGNSAGSGNPCCGGPGCPRPSRALQFCCAARRIQGCNGAHVITTSTTRLSLYFIRHGQTEWSLTGQHTGRTDIPLTPDGEDEARELTPWLSHIQFSRVFTSPRQRARRTCVLAGLGDKAMLEPDLAEWDYGEDQGKLSSDIWKERPGWNVFRDGCPGGEMPADVSVRADRLIKHICSMDGNIALWNHGEFGARPGRAVDRTAIGRGTAFLTRRSGSARYSQL